jgi:lysophospholipase L1-like esterase
MFRIVQVVAIVAMMGSGLWAQGVESLASGRVLFLGDSITQSGQYVSYAAYFLDKLYPERDFDVLGLGLSSETVSGLSEPGHAGGKFARPVLFERLGRVLERVKPQIVFACYGINDGIYQPLDPVRFQAFKDGITRLIADCQAAGVKQFILITPPIYDATPQADTANYDAVMAAYAAWEMTQARPGVHVVDLHTAMRQARNAQQEPISKDHIHPGEAGHLLMARTILAGVGIPTPDVTVEQVKADPLFKLVNDKRQARSSQWMKHVGYVREKTVGPEPLGDIEARAAQIQQQIDAIRRSGQ